MRRREFIALIGAAAGWPSILLAAGQRARVGLLTLLSQDDQGGRIAAFVVGLRELGYVPGQTVDIDYRFARGDTEQLRALARDLIALAPDVIFAGEPTAARAVKVLAPSLPIVCPALTDRLPDLFVSYARPGGSVTGLANIVEGLTTKLVELGHEVLPGLMHIGLMVNPVGANRDMVVEQVDAAARAHSVTVFVQEAREPDDLAPALDRLAQAGAQIVVIVPNGMFINRRRTIIEKALAIGLPTFFMQRQDVEAGGLMSYGINQTETSRRAAVFVDKILKGAKPGELPIEFPTKIELFINLKTAKALRLEIRHAAAAPIEVIE